MHGVAVAVRLGDELRRDDRDSAERHRDLEYLRALGGRGVAEDVAGDAARGRGEVDLRCQLVEAREGRVVEGRDDDPARPAEPVQVAGQHLGVVHVRGDVGVGLALDLDVDRDVRVLLHDLGQAHDPEVGRLVAGRRLHFAGADAAEGIVGVGAGGVVGSLPGHEPIARVELLDLRQGHVVDAARAVRGPVDGRVVDDHDLVVLAHVDVGLEHVGAESHRAVVRVHRVRRRLVLTALVGDVEGPQLGPVRRTRRRDRGQREKREDGGQRQEHEAAGQAPLRAGRSGSLHGRGVYGRRRDHAPGDPDGADHALAAATRSRS